jgi:hypothetical protein
VSAESVEIALQVDALVVETELDRDATDRLGPIVQEALLELAAALRRLPGAELERLDSLMLDRLDLDLDDPRALLGPGGSDRLANRLLERLLARTGELR